MSARMPVIFRSARQAFFAPSSLSRFSTSRFISTSRPLFQSESSSQQQQPQSNGEASAQNSEATAKLTEAQKKLTEQEETIKDLKEQVLRSLADAENTRKIAKRDVDNARQYSIQGFAKSLLEVADNLARAMEAIPVEQRSADKNPQLASLFEGIHMTEKELLKTFTTYGIKQVNPVGEKFDPNLHQAVFEIEDPSREINTVGAVYKVGYSINDRILRPAVVGVVKNRSKQQ